MDLRHLEYFVTVAEELSFTAAAARLYVVQSAVSTGVKALERELATTLFDRTSRRVELNAAGAAFLPHAYATLDASRDARDAVARIEGGLQGVLRVGTLVSAKIIDTARLLGAYHRKYPNVLLQVSAAQSGSRGLVEGVAERRLDLAFVSVPGDAPPPVTLTEISREPMDLVLPAGHPLARGSAVEISDLAGFDFIDSPLGFGNRLIADRAFAAAGITRRVTIEVTDVSSAPDYVRHGLGIALLPRFAVLDLEDLAVLPVTGADLSWPLSLATPRDRKPSAAANALVQIIHSEWPGSMQP